MNKIEKISLASLKQLSRNEMRSIMAGSSGDCKLPTARCGRDGEGKCNTVGNQCVCEVGSRVAEDSNCKD